MSYDFERLRGSYLYAPGARVDPAFRSGHWAEPVDRLLGAGYPFAGVGFGPDGVLFRAVACGLQAGLDAGRFGPAAGGEEPALVEQVMNVLFLTHEAGDAVSVAGLQRGPADAGILVLPAAVFHAAARRGDAAVLAVGDAGVVFRYPLLARPLATAEVCMLLVSAATAARLRPPPALAASVRVVDASTRDAVTRAISAALGERGLAPARPWPTDDRPRRG